MIKRLYIIYKKNSICEVKEKNYINPLESSLKIESLAANKFGNYS